MARGRGGSRRRDRGVRRRTFESAGRHRRPPRRRTGSSRCAGRPMERFAARRLPRPARRGVALHADRADRAGAPGVQRTGRVRELTRAAARPVRLRPRRLDHARLRERRSSATRSRADRPLPAGVRRGEPAPRRCRSRRRSARAHLGRHAPASGRRSPRSTRPSWPTGGFVRVPAGVELARPDPPALRRRPAEAGGAVDPPAQPARGRARRPGLDRRELRGAWRRGGVYSTNAVTEVAVGGGRLGGAHPDPARERARLSRRAHRTSTRSGTATIARSRWRWARALARHNLHVRLDGENVETLLYGLYLDRRRAAGRQPHGHLPRPAQLPELGGLQGHPGRTARARCSTARSS